MFKVAPGYEVPFPAKIKEEFQLYEHCIQFNLSFKKMRPMLEDFIEQLEEPLFIVLEIPLSLDEEEKLHKKDSDPYHNKVCYLDGQSKKQVSAILHKYGELILSDGMSLFGVASHVTNDEIFFSKYQVVYIYCTHPTEYLDFLQKYKLAKTDNLITAWDTFSHERSGMARRIEMNGIDIFDVYNVLVKMGMYEAKVI